MESVFTIDGTAWFFIDIFGNVIGPFTDPDKAFADRENYYESLEE